MYTYRENEGKQDMKQLKEWSQKNYIYFDKKDSVVEYDEGFTFSDDEDSDDRFIRRRQQFKKKREEKKGAHLLPFAFVLGTCSAILWATRSKAGGNECEEQAVPKLERNQLQSRGGMT